MANQCPKCGAPLKLVPAGISKSLGKPYQAFWACTDRACGYTQKQAVAPAVSPTQARAMGNIAKSTEDAKWTEISTGKVRHGVSCEFIRLGKPLNKQTVQEINDWTRYIMTGEYQSSFDEMEGPGAPPEIRVENIPF